MPVPGSGCRKLSSRTWRAIRPIAVHAIASSGRAISRGRAAAAGTASVAIAPPYGYALKVTRRAERPLSPPADAHSDRQQAEERGKPEGQRKDPA